ncbi:MAG: hemolysin family protein, partial [Gammaproteobacteria bacterium]
ALVRSAEELRVLFNQVKQHGVVDAEQARMLEGALELSEVQVRQVMVPRTAIVGLPVNASLEQAVAVIRQQPRRSYLVYEGASDQVVGVLHRKDLLLSLSERWERLERGEVVAPFELRSLVREAFFVPETKPLAELLEDFRRRRLHVAVVVDEFGSVQGMVTLTDIIETIVGEVRDEPEALPAPLPLTEGEVVLDARTSLLDLEHQHRIELPAGPGFETLAGFVLNRLGFIPQGGECFLHDGLRFTVVEMDGRRVARVKIEQIQARVAAAEGLPGR